MRRKLLIFAIVALLAASAAYAGNAFFLFECTDTQPKKCRVTVLVGGGMYRAAVPLEKVCSWSKA